MSTLEELVVRRQALPPPDDTKRVTLFDRFLLPPFSVLDARQGYWQKRKRMWLDLGIQSELGRGQAPESTMLPVTDGAGGLCDQRVGERHMTNSSDRAMELAGGFSARHGRANATPGGSTMPSTVLRDGKTQRGDGRCRAISDDNRRLAKTFNIGTQATKENDWSVEDNQGSGTSIFDPVLCEIAYRWFCPQMGHILDPFAGGSVRGIVAARLGRAYTGVDLRSEQVEANYTQADIMCPDADLTWAVGDSQDISTLVPGKYDLIFSCPPYYDLERYSNDQRDLSTMSYTKFLETYSAIITASCAMLRDDRFACFVVGDIRDRITGNYRGFVGDTITAFRAAGLELYNDAVLITSVGSLPIRVGKQFVGYRKLGKTHQNVLLFLKGDAGRATAACGPVDVEDVVMPMCAPGMVAVAETGADEATLLPLPTLEAYLMADLLRGEARATRTVPPRVWIGVGKPEVCGWERIEDSADLTYIVGGVPYLSRSIFPDAPLPPSMPLTPESLWE